jgi:hypothetical protein
MMTVHQLVVVLVIVQIVRRVHVVTMIVQPVVDVLHRVAQVLVVRRLVVVSAIAIRVQVVHVAMMIAQVAHAASMTVQRVHSQMRNVVPMKFGHAQVVVAMTAMQHRVTIISKSVGTMKVQHVHRVVDRAVVTTMHQSIWSVTRSAHQRQLSHT